MTGFHSSAANDQGADWREPGEREATPSLPWRGEPAHPLPADGGFTDVEHWAWERLSAGETADLAAAPGDARRISARFLETILFLPPWRASYWRPVVALRNARFEEAIDFESRIFDGKLAFEGCVFEDEVILTGLSLRRSLIFRGCAFKQRLLADRMSVGGLLIAEDTSFDDTVQLDDIAVATDVKITATTCRDLLSLDDARIRGSLFLGPDSDFQRIQARRMEVGKSVDLSESAFSREVALVGSRIGEELLLDSQIKVRKGWFSRSGETPPNFQNKTPPVWRGDAAKLNLRNLETRILQSSLEAWRRPDGKFVARDLTGLTFDRLGGGENRVESLHRESRKALVAWLAADLLRYDRALPNNGYSPARYRSLAKTLRETGHEAKARYVMWAMGRARKRALPVFSFAKIVETLSGQITGYGYQQIRGMIYAVLLVTSFAAVGMLWPEGPREGRDIFSMTDWTAWLGFSFEKAVPFSDLDPIDDSFLRDVFGPDLPRGMRAAFMAERVLGIVIIGFAIAGFTGWAERRGQ